MRRGWLVVFLAGLLTLALVVSVAAAPRFSVSSEGVIRDSQTGLEWVVGPDKDTNFNEAEAWVKICGIAGGNWRLPTLAELRGLYEKGLGQHNLDPAFKTTAKCLISQSPASPQDPITFAKTPTIFVWSGPGDSYSTFAFHFGQGAAFPRDVSGCPRVFAVRSPSKR